MSPLSRKYRHFPGKFIIPTDSSPTSLLLSHKPTHQLLSYTPPDIHPIHISQRHFLGNIFEKQRKLSWVLHRRKKMEMSADLLSRPTHRPARTEAMDLIMKQAYDVTLGPGLGGSLVLSPTMAIKEQPIYDIDMSKLSIRQQMYVIYLAARSHSWVAFGVYMGLYWSQFAYTYYHLKQDPKSVRKLCMDILDSNNMQTMHQVIDSYPSLVDFLLAFGITQSFDVVRIPLFLLIAKFYFERKGIVQLDQEEYDKIKYRFEIEERFDHDLKMDNIDPTLAAGLVPHPGVEAPERLDFYGRDRWRDYIPKDKPELEYALFSWQRVAMIRRRKEQRLRRGKNKKSKHVGPRWAKVGFGIFQGRA